MKIIDGIGGSSGVAKEERWKLLRSDTGELYKLRSYGRFSNGPLEPLKMSDLENLARAYMSDRLVDIPERQWRGKDWEENGYDEESYNKWLGYLVMGAPIGKEPFGPIKVLCLEKEVDTNAPDFWVSYSLSDMEMGRWLPRHSDVWGDEALELDFSRIFVKGTASIQCANGSCKNDDRFSYYFTGWHHWDKQREKLRVYIDAPDHLLDQPYKPLKRFEWEDLLQAQYVTHVGVTLPENPTIRDVAERMCFRNWVVARKIQEGKKNQYTFEENVEIVPESYNADYTLSPWATRSGPSLAQRSLF